MDPLSVELRVLPPTDPAVADLFERHLAFAHASSPACSVHAKAAGDLRGSHFVALIAGSEAVGMGALTVLDPGHGEIKSMHVRSDHRGNGHADSILKALLAEARRRGMTRVSLETGSRAVFAPARALYLRHGFEPTGPFASYTDDPESHYMTLEL